MPHDDPESAFAVERSSRSTRFGSAAWLAGSKGEARLGGRGHGQPDLAAGAHEEEPEAEKTSAHVRGDHDLPAIETVDEMTGRRRSDQVGELLDREYESHEDGRSRDRPHEDEQRDEQEPVAAEGDQRSDV